MTQLTRTNRYDHVLSALSAIQLDAKVAVAQNALVRVRHAVGSRWFTPLPRRYYPTCTRPTGISHGGSPDAPVNANHAQMNLADTRSGPIPAADKQAVEGKWRGHIQTTETQVLRLGKPLDSYPSRAHKKKSDSEGLVPINPSTEATVSTNIHADAAKRHVSMGDSESWQTVIWPRPSKLKTHAPDQPSQIRPTETMSQKDDTLGTLTLTVSHDESATVIHHGSVYRSQRRPLPSQWTDAPSEASKQALPVATHQSSQPFQQSWPQSVARNPATQDRAFTRENPRVQKYRAVYSESQSFQKPLPHSYPQLMTDSSMLQLPYP